MNLPVKYKTARLTLADQVSYGYGGIRLFTLDEIEQGQVGYSIASGGESLCSGEPGAWMPSWIAIGYELACGDPLFIGTDDPSIPVFTAMHGEDTWDPVVVSVSIEAFATTFEAFASIARGRSNPVELERNPLPVNEREEFLSGVATLNGGAGIDLWTSLLET